MWYFLIRERIGAKLRYFFFAGNTWMILKKEFYFLKDKGRVRQIKYRVDFYIEWK